MTQVAGQFDQNISDFSNYINGCEGLHLLKGIFLLISQIVLETLITVIT